MRVLLIDNFDIHGFLLRSSEEEWAWLKRFFLTRVFGGLGERKDRALVKRSNKSDDIRQRNLVSKFLYRSLEAPAKLSRFSISQKVFCNLFAIFSCSG